MDTISNRTNTVKRLMGSLVGILGLALVVSSHVASAATECNGAVSGAVVGGVVVNAGDFCMLDGANVSGGVRVNSGGILIACGSVINGGIVSDGAAGILIGPEEIACDGDTINGGVQISNTGPGVFPEPAPSIAVENSAISGSVHLTGNQGMMAVAFNTIFGGLFCSNNIANPADEGAPSVITGPTRCTFEEESE